MSTFEVYDALGRQENDSVVQRWMQRLGAVDSIQNDYKGHTIFFASGARISAQENGEVGSVRFDLNLYKASLPFGFNDHTTINQVWAIFPGVKLKGKETLQTSYAPGGFFSTDNYIFMLGWLNAEEHLFQITFSKPKGYCHTRESHFVGYDLVALRQKPGEADADFRQRIAPEEKKLIQSLSQNRDLTAQAVDKNATEHVISLSDWHCQLEKYNQAGEYYNLTIESRIKRSVKVPKKEAKAFEANIAKGSLHIQCRPDDADCNVRWDMLKTIQVNGKAYEIDGEVTKEGTILIRPVSHLEGEF